MACDGQPPLDGVTPDEVLETLDRAALVARLRVAEAQARQRAAELEALHQAERQRRQELDAAYAQQLRLAADFRTAFRAEQERRRQLDAVYLQTLQVLAHAVEVRDDYTGGHVERVRRYSAAIAGALGLDPATQQAVRMGAVLHDVGKIGVPDAVLRKRGTLTAPEWRQMQTHPQKGAALLRDATFLAGAIAGVVSHHERWDGRGYPQRLRGEAIPLAGRIVAVADAFDAMTTDRPYRRGLTVEMALEEIERGRETQFDPDIVTIFLRLWHDGALRDIAWGRAEVPDGWCGSPGRNLEC